MSIKGIIFDCDGTLADTMPLHWRAWQSVAQRHGIHFPEERFYLLGGVPSRHILQMLRHEQQLSIDPFAVSKEKEAAYLELLSHVAPIEPGNVSQQACDLAENVVEVGDEFRKRVD